MARILRVRHRRPISDFIYQLYCVIGAFYYSPAVHGRARLLWYALNAACVLLVTVVGSGGYLLTSQRLTVSNVAFVLWQFNAVCYTLVFIPAVTYRFRRHIQTLIDAIDADFHCVDVGGPPDGRRRRRYDSRRRACMVAAVQVALAVCYVSVNVVDVLFFFKAESLGDVNHYVYPFPFIERVRSTRVYFALYATQLVYSLAMFTVGSLFPAFTVAVGSEFFNACVDLCARIRSRSRQLVDAVEGRRGGAGGVGGAEVTWTSVSAEFGDDMIRLVKQHQNLLASIRLIKPFVEIFFSVLVVCFFIAQLATVYVIFVADVEMTLKIKQILLLSAANTVFYSYCILGKNFEDMDAAMTLEVYSIPWYYLQAKHRRIVYIFLCQVQRPTLFYAFSVYPVTMVTFPRMMNVVYSYINLLRSGIQGSQTHDR